MEAKDKHHQIGDCVILGTPGVPYVHGTAVRRILPGEIPLFKGTVSAWIEAGRTYNHMSLPSGKLALVIDVVGELNSLITNPKDLILGEQNHIHYSLCDGVNGDWQRKRDFAGFGLRIASLLEPGVTAIILDKLFDPVDNVVVHFDGWTFNINVCFLDRLEPFSLPEKNGNGLCDF